MDGFAFKKIYMKSLEVYATSRTKVTIDPINVIEQLIAKAMGCTNGWVIEEKGSYYVCNEQYKNSTERSVINKKEYDYIMALELVSVTLGNQKDV